MAYYKLMVKLHRRTDYESRIEEFFKLMFPELCQQREENAKQALAKLALTQGLVSNMCNSYFS